MLLIGNFFLRKIVPHNLCLFFCINMAGSERMVWKKYAHEGKYVRYGNFCCFFCERIAFLHNFTSTNCPTYNVIDFSQVPYRQISRTIFSNFFKKKICFNNNTRNEIFLARYARKRRRVVAVLCSMFLLHANIKAR